MAPGFNVSVYENFTSNLIYDNSGDVLAFEGESATFWCIVAGK